MAKKIYEEVKESNEEAVWQEKMKHLEIKARRQHVIESKKYSVEITLK